MKRFLSGLICAISLASASIVAAKDLSSYATNAHASGKPSAPTLDIKKIGFYPTEISIYNDSPYYIYFTSTANYLAIAIEPYSYRLITNPYYSDDVIIQLYDESLNVFWDSWVCSKAQLSVQSFWWGGHHIDVNEGACGYFYKKK